MAKPNALILGAFVLAFLTRLLYWLPRDLLANAFNSWAYTDWLTDYSAGFVRRGLSGELVDLGSALARPQVIIIALAWFLLCALVYGYLRLCIRAHHCLSPLTLTALLFLPSLIPFYLYDHAAFGRKEMLGFPILLWHLYVLERNNGDASKGRPGAIFYPIVLEKYVKRLLPITVVLLPIHILVHESSFLLFVPVHLVITFSMLRADGSRTVRRQLVDLAFLYAPVLMVVSAVFIWGRPSFEMAHAISKKWELAHALPAGASNIAGKEPMWALPEALTALPWTLAQAASLSLSLSAGSIVAWLLVFAVLGWATAYFGGWAAVAVQRSQDIGLSGALERRHAEGMVGRYFLLPLLASLPLYVLGWDLGRWFAVSCINFAMISLSADVNRAEAFIHASKGTGTHSGTAGAGAGMGPYYVKVMVLLLVIFFIRLPHCCNNWLNIFSEPLAVVLKIAGQL